jgi:ankyrin repeat protein
MSFKYERFLVEAIEQCQLQKILTCIKHGHNIYIQNNHGQNLLVHLLKQQNAQDIYFERKRLQIFQFLITQCNLDIYSFDCHGKNLFNWAANLNCTQEALYLLRNYPGDIDILIRDHTGLCSLHYAIEHGNEILVHAIVDYLLQYRIRFDIIDNHNNTPEELARKLGYDHISEYLAETCRSTIFMSRDIPFYQQRVSTDKSKNTAMTKISTSSGSSSSTSSLPDITEFYQLIESKIEIARNLNDWKTVALLRTCQRNLNGRKSNQLRKFIFQKKMFVFH